MPRAAVLVVSAAAATLLMVGGGVLARGEGDENSPTGTQDVTATTRTTDTTDPTTPLSKFDTSDLVVTRGPFCDQLSDAQVAAALGGEPVESAEWEDGDTIDVGNGGQDVGHEFGCRYTAADGTGAQAWMFVPPVDAQQAQQLVKSAARASGCTVGAGPPFGSPTLALTCTKDGVARASYRGLFGDAWIVCEVTRPAGATWDVADRAGRWCVGVLLGQTSPERG